MRKGVEGVIAILCSDLHLSHKAPIARSAEPDWYEAMRRPLQELRRLERLYGVPVICAGDIFDRWNSPAELINFAMDNLPEHFYAIPGQHDLPFHSLEDIEKSAYWTLVAAGRITNLPAVSILSKEPKLQIYAFPWGTEVKPREEIVTKHVHGVPLAVVHSYIWTSGNNYPGASKESRIGRWLKKLKGYSAAAFGDNHRGFHRMGDEGYSHVFNCGTFIRRKVDEMKYDPQVGLLTSNGEIIPYYLQTHEDVFIDIASALGLMEKAFDFEDFLNELGSLGDKALNFFEAVESFCKANKIDKQVVKIIQQSLRKD